MEYLAKYITREVVLQVAFFGAGWQFLRWFILTSWVVKTIEHWIGYIAKLVTSQIANYTEYAAKGILQNGKSIIVECWKYRFGKIVIVLLGFYLLYLLYQLIF